MTYEQRVKKILQTQLGLCDKDMNFDSIEDLESLGYVLDSLDHIELAMEIEEEFEIEISDSDLEKFDSISSIVKYLKTYDNGSFTTEEFRTLQYKLKEAENKIFRYESLIHSLKAEVLDLFTKFKNIS